MLMASSKQQLWSDKHQHTGASGVAANATAAAGGGRSDAPRDVASMKAEIAELQSGTTACLDRAIAAAEASGSIASNTSTTLREQRQQMGEIEAEARGIDNNLKRTGYNLKHGLTWRGALTSPFRRNKPTAKTAGGVRRNFSPVFKDDYDDSRPTAPAAAPSYSNSSNNSTISSPKKKAGFFKGRAKAGAAAAPVVFEKPMVPEHAPDGFEAQLDTLDGLLDGLNLQAKAIGAELKQQNEGIEALGERVEPLRQETASQAKQIKRRFG